MSNNPNDKILPTGSANIHSKESDVASPNLGMSSLDVVNRLGLLNESRPFRTRFSRWIKWVAIAILLTFIPEQVSWAFNYNPVVLWGKTPHLSSPLGGEEQGEGAGTINSSLTPEQITSHQIAQSVESLLSLIAYKERTRVQLQLPNSSETDPQLSQNRSLLIDANVFLTRNNIQQFTSWLKTPDIHPLNCGVYVLRDILTYYDIDVSLEELSVMSIVVDILSDIIKPGDPKLKTSLFAINKIVDAYGLNLKSARMASEDILKLKTPFIANFKDEHFVMVTAVQEGYVFYNDIGRAAMEKREEFLAQLSGFVLAPSLDEQESIAFEYIPDSLKAFVWGSKYHKNSDSLPGLGLEEIFLGVAIQVAITLATAGLTGGNFAFSLAVSQFGSTMGTLCYNAGACTELGAMVLSSAISAGINMGAGALDATSVTNAAWESAGEQAIKDGLEKKIVEEIVANFTKSLAKEFAVGFAQGAVIGAATGFVQYEIMQVLDDALGDNMDPILRQAIIGIISSLGANLAVGVGFKLIDKGFDALTGLSKGDVAAQAADEWNKMSPAEQKAQQIIAFKADSLDAAKEAFVAQRVSDRGFNTGLSTAFGMKDLPSNKEFGAQLWDFLLFAVKRSNIVQQLVGMAARYVASGFGVESDTNLSQAIGQLVGQLAVTLYDHRSEIKNLVKDIASGEFNKALDELIRDADKSTVTKLNAFDNLVDEVANKAETEAEKELSNMSPEDLEALRQKLGKNSLEEAKQAFVEQKMAEAIAPYEEMMQEIWAIAREGTRRGMDQFQADIAKAGGIEEWLKTMRGKPELKGDIDKVSLDAGKEWDKNYKENSEELSSLGGDLQGEKAKEAQETAKKNREDFIKQKVDKYVEQKAKDNYLKEQRAQRFAEVRDPASKDPKAREFQKSNKQLAKNFEKFVLKDLSHEQLLARAISDDPAVREIKKNAGLVDADGEEVEGLTPEQAKARKREFIDEMAKIYGVKKEVIIETYFPEETQKAREAGDAAVKEAKKDGSKAENVLEEKRNKGYVDELSKLIETGDVIRGEGDKKEVSPSIELTGYPKHEFDPTFRGERLPAGKEQKIAVNLAGEKKIWKILVVGLLTIGGAALLDSVERKWVNGAKEGDQQKERMQLAAVSALSYLASGLFSAGATIYSSWRDSKKYGPNGELLPKKIEVTAQNVFEETLKKASGELWEQALRDNPDLDSARQNGTPLTPDQIARTETIERDIKAKATELAESVKTKVEDYYRGGQASKASDETHQRESKAFYAEHEEVLNARSPSLAQAIKEGKPLTLSQEAVLEDILPGVNWSATNAAKESYDATYETAIKNAPRMDENDHPTWVKAFKDAFGEPLGAIIQGHYTANGNAPYQFVEQEDGSLETEYTGFAKEGLTKEQQLASGLAHFTAYNDYFNSMFGWTPARVVYLQRMKKEMFAKAKANQEFSHGPLTEEELRALHSQVDQQYQKSSYDLTNPGINFIHSSVDFLNQGLRAANMSPDRGFVRGMEYIALGRHINNIPMLNGKLVQVSVMDGGLFGLLGGVKQGDLLGYGPRGEGAYFQDKNSIAMDFGRLTQRERKEVLTGGNNHPSFGFLANGEFLSVSDPTIIDPAEEGVVTVEYDANGKARLVNRIDGATPLNFGVYTGIFEQNGILDQNISINWGAFKRGDRMVSYSASKAMGPIDPLSDSWIVDRGDWKPSDEREAKIAAFDAYGEALKDGDSRDEAEMAAMAAYSKNLYTFTSMGVVQDYDAKFRSLANAPQEADQVAQVAKAEARQEMRQKFQEESKSEDLTDEQIAKINEEGEKIYGETYQKEFTKRQNQSIYLAFTRVTGKHTGNGTQLDSYVERRTGVQPGVSSPSDGQELGVSISANYFSNAPTHPSPTGGEGSREGDAQNRGDLQNLVNAVRHLGKEYAGRLVDEISVDPNVPTETTRDLRNLVNSLNSDSRENTENKENLHSLIDTIRNDSTTTARTKEYLQGLEDYVNGKPVGAADQSIEDSPQGIYRMMLTGVLPLQRDEVVNREILRTGFGTRGAGAWEDVQSLLNLANAARTLAPVSEAYELANHRAEGLEPDGLFLQVGGSSNLDGKVEGGFSGSSWYNMPQADGPNGEKMTNFMAMGVKSNGYVSLFTPTQSIRLSSLPQNMNNTLNGTFALFDTVSLDENSVALESDRGVFGEFNTNPRKVAQALEAVLKDESGKYSQEEKLRAKDALVALMWSRSKPDDRMDIAPQDTREKVSAAEMQKAMESAAQAQMNDAVNIVDKFFPAERYGDKDEMRDSYLVLDVTANNRIQSFFIDGAVKKGTEQQTRDFGLTNKVLYQRPIKELEISKTGEGMSDAVTVASFEYLSPEVIRNDSLTLLGLGHSFDQVMIENLNPVIGFGSIFYNTSLVPQGAGYNPLHSLTRHPYTGEIVEGNLEYNTITVIAKDGKGSSDIRKWGIFGPGKAIKLANVVSMSEYIKAGNEKAGVAETTHAYGMTLVDENDVASHFTWNGKTWISPKGEAAIEQGFVQSEAELSEDLRDPAIIAAFQKKIDEEGYTLSPPSDEAFHKYESVRTHVRVDDNGWIIMGPNPGEKTETPRNPILNAPVSPATFELGKSNGPSSFSSASTGQTTTDGQSNSNENVTDITEAFRRPTKMALSQEERDRMAADLSNKPDLEIQENPRDSIPFTMEGNGGFNHVKDTKGQNSPLVLLEEGTELLFVNEGFFSLAGNMKEGQMSVLNGAPIVHLFNQRGVSREGKIVEIGGFRRYYAGVNPDGTYKPYYMGYGVDKSGNLDPNNFNATTDLAQTYRRGTYREIDPETRVDTMNIVFSEILRSQNGSLGYQDSKVVFRPGEEGEGDGIGSYLGLGGTEVPTDDLIDWEETSENPAVKQAGWALGVIRNPEDLQKPQITGIEFTGLARLVPQDEGDSFVYLRGHGVDALNIDGQNYQVSPGLPHENVLGGKSETVQGAKEEKQTPGPGHTALAQNSVNPDYLIFGGSDEIFDRTIGDLKAAGKLPKDRKVGEQELFIQAEASNFDFNPLAPGTILIFPSRTQDSQGGFDSEHTTKYVSGFKIVSPSGKIVSESTTTVNPYPDSGGGFFEVEDNGRMVVSQGWLAPGKLNRETPIEISGKWDDFLQEGLKTAQEARGLGFEMSDAEAVVKATEYAKQEMEKQKALPGDDSVMGRGVVNLTGVQASKQQKDGKYVLAWNKITDKSGYLKTPAADGGKRNRAELDNIIIGEDGNLLYGYAGGSILHPDMDLQGPSGEGEPNILPGGQNFDTSKELVTQGGRKRTLVNLPDGKSYYLVDGGVDEHGVAVMQPTNLYGNTKRNVIDADGKMAGTIEIGSDGKLKSALPSASGLREMREAPDIEVLLRASQLTLDADPDLVSSEINDILFGERDPDLDNLGLNAEQIIALKKELLTSNEPWAVHGRKNLSALGMFSMGVKDFDEAGKLRSTEDTVAPEGTMLREMLLYYDQVSANSEYEPYELHELGSDGQLTLLARGRNGPTAFQEREITGQGNNQDKPDVVGTVQIETLPTGEPIPTLPKVVNPRTGEVLYAPSSVSGLVDLGGAILPLALGSATTHNGPGDDRVVPVDGYRLNYNYSDPSELEVVFGNTSDQDAYLWYQGKIDSPKPEDNAAERSASGSAVTGAEYTLSPIEGNDNVGSAQGRFEFLVEGGASYDMNFNPGAKIAFGNNTFHYPLAKDFSVYGPGVTIALPEANQDFGMYPWQSADGSTTEIERVDRDMRISHLDEGKPSIPNMSFAEETRTSGVLLGDEGETLVMSDYTIPEMRTTWGADFSGGQLGRWNLQNVDVTGDVLQEQYAYYRGLNDQGESVELSDYSSNSSEGMKTRSVWNGEKWEDRQFMLFPATVWIAPSNLKGDGPGGSSSIAIEPESLELKTSPVFPGTDKVILRSVGNVPLTLAMEMQGGQIGDGNAFRPTLLSADNAVHKIVDPQTEEIVYPEYIPQTRERSVDGVITGSPSVLDDSQLASLTYGARYGGTFVFDSTQEKGVRAIVDDNGYGWAVVDQKNIDIPYWAENQGDAIGEEAHLRDRKLLQWTDGSAEDMYSGVAMPGFQQKWETDIFSSQVRGSVEQWDGIARPSDQAKIETSQILGYETLWLNEGTGSLNADGVIEKKEMTRKTALPALDTIGSGLSFSYQKAGEQDPLGDEKSQEQIVKVQYFSIDDAPGSGVRAVDAVTTVVRDNLVRSEGSLFYSLQYDEDGELNSFHDAFWVKNARHEFKESSTYDERSIIQGQPAPWDDGKLIPFSPNTRVGGQGTIVMDPDAERGFRVENGDIESLKTVTSLDGERRQSLEKYVFSLDRLNGHWEKAVRLENGTMKALEQQRPVGMVSGAYLNKLLSVFGVGLASNSEVQVVDIVKKNGSGDSFAVVNYMNNTRLTMWTPWVPRIIKSALGDLFTQYDSKAISLKTGNFLSLNPGDVFSRERVVDSNVQLPNGESGKMIEHVTVSGIGSKSFPVVSVSEMYNLGDKGFFRQHINSYSVVLGTMQTNQGERDVKVVQMDRGLWARVWRGTAGGLTEGLRWGLSKLPFGDSLRRMVPEVDSGTYTEKITRDENNDPSVELIQDNFVLTRNDGQKFDVTNKDIRPQRNGIMDYATHSFFGRQNAMTSWRQITSGLMELGGISRESSDAFALTTDWTALGPVGTALTASVGGKLMMGAKAVWAAHALRTARVLGGLGAGYYVAKTSLTDEKFYFGRFIAAGYDAAKVGAGFAAVESVVGAATGLKWYHQLAASEAINLGVPNAVNIYRNHDVLPWRVNLALFAVGATYPISRWIAAPARDAIKSATTAKVAAAGVEGGAALVESAAVRVTWWNVVRMGFSEALLVGQIKTGVAATDAAWLNQGKIDVFGWNDSLIRNYAEGLGQGLVFGTAMGLGAKAATSSFFSRPYAGRIALTGGSALVGPILTGSATTMSDPQGWGNWMNNVRASYTPENVVSWALAGLAFKGIPFSKKPYADWSGKLRWAERGFAATAGAGIMVIHGAMEPGDYSWGRGIGEAIAGAGIGLLARSYLRGTKNIHSISDAAKKEAAGPSLVQMGQNPELFHLASVKGALKWPLVSFSFTVGGAFWKGVSTKIEVATDFAINKAESRYKDNFDSWHDVPWFLLDARGTKTGEEARVAGELAVEAARERGVTDRDVLDRISRETAKPYTIELFSAEGKDELIRGIIHGPEQGFWMAPLFQVLQVQGGKVDAVTAREAWTKGGVRETFKWGLSRAQNGLARWQNPQAGRISKLAGKWAGKIWRDVVYMPGFVTGVNQAVDHLSNGGIISLASLSNWKDGNGFIPAGRTIIGPAMVEALGYVGMLAMPSFHAMPKLDFAGQRQHFTESVKEIRGKISAEEKKGVSDLRKLAELHGALGVALLGLRVTVETEEAAGGTPGPAAEKPSWKDISKAYKEGEKFGLKNGLLVLAKEGITEGSAGYDSAVRALKQELSASRREYLAERERFKMEAKYARALGLQEESSAGARIGESEGGTEKVQEFSEEFLAQARSAEHHLRRAVKLNPNDAGSHFNLGQVLEVFAKAESSSERKNSAKEMFERAHGLASQQNNAGGLMAEAAKGYKRVGGTEDLSKKVSQSLVPVDVARRTVQLLLEASEVGNLSGVSDSRKTNIEELSKRIAQTLNPESNSSQGSNSIHEQLSQAIKEARASHERSTPEGKAQKSQERAKKAAKSAQTFFDLGITALKSNDFQGAKSHFREASQRFKKAAELAGTSQQELARKMNLSEALSLATDVKARRGDSEEAIFIDEAIRQFDRARQLDPEHFGEYSRNILLELELMAKSQGQDHFRARWEHLGALRVAAEQASDAVIKERSSWRGKLSGRFLDFKARLARIHFESGLNREIINALGSDRNIPESLAQDSSLRGEIGERQASADRSRGNLEGAKERLLDALNADGKWRLFGKLPGLALAKWQDSRAQERLNETFGKARKNVRAQELAKRPMDRNVPEGVEEAEKAKISERQTAADQAEARLVEERGDSALGRRWERAKAKADYWWKGRQLSQAVASAQRSIESNALKTKAATIESLREQAVSGESDDVKAEAQAALRRELGFRDKSEAVPFSEIEKLAKKMEKTLRRRADVKRMEKIPVVGRARKYLADRAGRKIERAVVRLDRQARTKASAKRMRSDQEEIAGLRAKAAGQSESAETVRKELRKKLGITPGELDGASEESLRALAEKREASLRASARAAEWGHVLGVGETLRWLADRIAYQGEKKALGKVQRSAQAQKHRTEKEKLEDLVGFDNISGLREALSEELTRLAGDNGSVGDGSSGSRHGSSTGETSDMKKEGTDPTSAISDLEVRRIANLKIAELKRKIASAENPSNRFLGLWEAVQESRAEAKKNKELAGIGRSVQARAIEAQPADRNVPEGASEDAKAKIKERQTAADQAEARLVEERGDSALGRRWERVKATVDHLRKKEQLSRTVEAARIHGEKDKLAALVKEAEEPGTGEEKKPSGTEAQSPKSGARKSKGKKETSSVDTKKKESQSPLEALRERLEGRAGELKGASKEQLIALADAVVKRLGAQEEAKKREGKWDSLYKQWRAGREKKAEGKAYKQANREVEQTARETEATRIQGEKDTLAAMKDKAKNSVEDEVEKPPVANEQGSKSGQKKSKDKKGTSSVAAPKEKPQSPLEALRERL